MVYLTFGFHSFDLVNNFHSLVIYHCFFSICPWFWYNNCSSDFCTFLKLELERTRIFTSVLNDYFLRYASRYFIHFHIDTNRLLQGSDSNCYHFQSKYICISKIAMSSVYYNSQICYNKPRQHSSHRLSMATLNSIGFNTDPWCTPKLLINAYTLFCVEMF